MAFTGVFPFSAGTTAIPIQQAMVVENVGTSTAWLTYNVELPEPYRGHELQPGQRLTFQGSADPLHVQCDGDALLLISGLK